MPPGALLAAVEDCFLWGLFDHAPLPRWTAGRLALLGDACHPMLPFLAQGATMALEDAWVLAAALDRAADPGEGLAAYAAARLPRADAGPARGGAERADLPPAAGAARAGAGGAGGGLGAGAGVAGRPVRLALRRRRDRGNPRVDSAPRLANLAGPNRGRRAECWSQGS